MAQTRAGGLVAAAGLGGGVAGSESELTLACGSEIGAAPPSVWGVLSV